MKFKALIACSSLLLSLAAPPAFALNREQVKTFTLANGMKFLVVENRAIPNANFYTFFKVGSRNEVTGITGISHFFEHMMFNGAKRYGPKQFDRTMEARGGSNNAFTNNDVTVYQDWFPASSLETIFALEGDRIGSLAIDPKMVESERQVVMSERSTGLENSNFRMLDEVVTASAFRAHPYGWSVMGHESDIKAWTQDDLRRYFDIYYAPNNAVAVIVGDVQFDEVKRLAEQYIGPIAARPAPPALRTVEPEQTGERRVFVQKDSASTPNLIWAYKVPPANHADNYALDVMESLLVDGKTSRLYKALVETRLATEISTDRGLNFDPGLLQFFSVAADGVSAAKLEQAFNAAIKQFVDGGISEQELQKVKNQKLMGFYRGLQTIDGQAQNVGNYEVFFGGYAKLFDAPAAYQKLTVADIKAVAARYLKKSHRTVGVLAAKED